jgi:fucose 4-O-acetylase-like acetyltransferase
MRRIELLDYTKGVLILTVVIGHAIQYMVYQNKGFWTDPFFKAIYMFHMPLFMMVAGYLSFRGITETSQPISYLKAKAKAYIIPIFAWASIYQIILYIVDDHKLIGRLPHSIIHDAVSSLWFLWALFGSIACMVIAQATGKYRGCTISFIFAASLLLPTAGNIYLFQYTFPFFIMGFYLKKKNAIDIQTKHQQAITLIFAFLSCLCFIYWTTDTYIYTTKMNFSEENLKNIIGRWAMGTITSIFVILILNKAIIFTPDKLKRAAIAIGRDSLYIYILQGYIFLGITEVIHRSSYVIINPYLGDLLGLFMGIAICWISWQIAHGAAQFKIFSKIFFGKS